MASVVTTPLACAPAPPAPLSCRGLTPGAYIPDARTTGVAPGTQLRRVDQTVVVTQDGTVIENQDIHGSVDVRAKNVTIRNSIVRGGPPESRTALIQATNRAVVNLRVEGVTLRPEHPTLWSNGIAGHDYTARCVDVSETVDGFRGHYPADPTKPTNVVITQSFCHDLAYWSPDPTHHDDQSHNDCFQGEGARDVAITFNRLDAYVSKTVGTLNSPKPQALSAIMVNRIDVGGVTHQPARWTVTDNWINGGYIPVNGGDDAVVAPELGRMLRNVFDRGAFHEGHTLSFGDKIGVETGDGTPDQNVYQDGTPVKVRHNA